MTVQTTEILGILQSDILIRQAVLAGLEFLRDKPHLLDFVFASLKYDELSQKLYGASLIQRAKEWYLGLWAPNSANPGIAVFMSTRTEKPVWPAISIKLNSSNEQENTLGDVHYAPREDSDLDWPSLYGPFQAKSYDPFKGYLTLPDDVADKLFLTTFMLIIDDAGLPHPIENVIDAQTVQIETGLHVGFSQAQVKAQPPAYIAEVESANFQESYLIGCHVGGDVEQLYWLHSILVFILLVFRQKYLEGRGFERTFIASSDPIQNPAFQEEVVYSRYLTITGYVRQTWPKGIYEKVTGTETTALFGQVNSVDVEVDVDSDSLSGASLMSTPDPRTLPFVYYGVANNPLSVDATFIQSLSGLAASQTHQRSIIFEAGSVSQYCWYAFPTAMGDGVTGANFIDLETHDIASFTKITTILINNINYDVWRSNQTHLGTFTVEVF